MCSRSRALAWAVGAAFTVLLASSFLPLWDRWYVHLSGEKKYASSAWKVIRSLPDNRRDIESFADLWAMHAINMAKVLALVIISIAASCCVFQLRRSRSLKWLVPLLFGTIATCAVGLARADRFEAEHWISPFVLAFFALLLFVEHETDADAPDMKVPDEAINRLLALKNEGSLLGRGRARVRQRARMWPITVSPPESTATEPLDRLMLAKRRLTLGGSSTSPPTAPAPAQTTPRSPLH